MPNAKDARGRFENHNFLLIGPPGSGKTTQFRTLPSPGFLYLFDPAAIASLEGLDIEYEQFSPDTLDINVHPLGSKDRSGKPIKADRVIQSREPETYVKWEEDWDKKKADRFFDRFKWLGIDSFTTFADAVMDRVQWINNRLGKQPEQDDWSAQMFTIQNVFREWAAYQKPMIATAHDELRQEEKGGAMKYQPVMTGRLRTRIPILFSDIFRCEAETVGGSTNYLFHLASDSRHQYVRTSVAIQRVFIGREGGMPSELDVSIPIESFDEAQEFGLGSLLRKAGLLEASSVQPQKSAKRSRR